MSLAVSAQKVFFIYLQSESEQPFFVKMNEKVHGSSSTGYLILPKLADSTYNFTLGFPQNKWPEQKFSVIMNRKDHGYLVKNFGEKGWGLFDLQTLAVQMSSSATAKVETPIKEENKNVSAFTDILSKASDDPSLKEKTVSPPVEEKKAVAVVQPEVKTEPRVETKKEEIKEKPVTKPVETTQPPIVKKEEVKTEIKETPPVKQAEISSKPEEKKEEVAIKPVENPTPPEPKTIATETIVVKEEQNNISQEEYKRSTVSKRSESSTTEGFGLTFIDNYDNGTTDTIKILIPNPKTVVAIKEQPKEEKKFLDIQTSPATEPLKESPKSVTASTTPVTTETTNPATAPKGNCNEIATESDFFKLRKTMAAAENDDDMIGEARKQFKVKCFTTAQLKNLGTLFLNDENKYRFFDAAYNFTSDKESFSSLQTELKDEYYINRFKAMLRN
ncbi:hypothetical protein CAP36_12760 [Chitinophagaceae bacterium IBVUCB2]|nr:hypothetical protein CAP36_12760 [Chitinophagaceae bacterium IBVUCB2]